MGAISPPRAGLGGGSWPRPSQCTSLQSQRDSQPVWMEPPSPAPTQLCSKGVGGSPNPPSWGVSSTEQPESPILGSCWVGYRAQTTPVCPRTLQQLPSPVPGRCNLMEGGLQGDHPLPEVLLWSRNSICSLCPLFSAKARGVGHWGSPVAQVTVAPQKSSACVSARSPVVTAAHRACGRTRRAVGEAEGSQGGTRRSTENRAEWECGEQPDPRRLPAAKAGQRRLELGGKSLEQAANPSLKEPG